MGLGGWVGDDSGGCLAIFSFIKLKQVRQLHKLHVYAFMCVCVHWGASPGLPHPQRWCLCKEVAALVLAKPRLA